jgi:hypothetical protein
MKYSLLLFVIIIFSFCTNVDSKQRAKKTEKKSKYAKLLSRYKSISFDTLEVFSTSELESNTYKFKGKQLDSADASLFPNEISKEYFNNAPGLFACYKFNLDSFRVGLITRTPSEYEPSSIKLFLFDIRKDTITDYLELAEFWGDAGDVVNKTSWLLKDKKNKYKSFIRENQSYDHSAEDEKDTTVDYVDYYWLIDLSKEKQDTLSNDSLQLVTHFKNLIIK